MPKKLSALLVEDRIVTFKQMDAAVQRQKKAGGRVGTNLLELNSISEEMLVRYVARTRGLPPLHLSELASVEPSVPWLLTPGQASDLGAIPFSDDGEVVKLAVVDPLTPEKLGELGALISRRFEQYVMLESRFWQALSAFYGLEVPSRMAALNARHPAVISLNRAVPTPAGARAPAAPSFSLAADAPPGLTWSVQQVSAFFDSADDRDEILLSLLGFSGKFFATRMLLVVSRTELRGFALQAPVPPRTAIEQVTIERVSGMPLDRLCEGGNYFVGPPAAAGTVALYEQLGLPLPSEQVLLPIRLGPRVALLLVGDAERALNPRVLTVLFAVCERMSRALAALIRTRKQSGAVPRRVSGSMTTVTPADVAAHAAASALAGRQAEEILAGVAETSQPARRGLMTMPEGEVALQGLDALTEAAGPAEPATPDGGQPRQPVAPDAAPGPGMGSPAPNEPPHEVAPMSTPAPPASPRPEAASAGEPVAPTPMSTGTESPGREPVRITSSVRPRVDTAGAVSAPGGPNDTASSPSAVTRALTVPQAPVSGGATRPVPVPTPRPATRIAAPTTAGLAAAFEALTTGSRVTVDEDSWSLPSEPPAPVAPPEPSAPPPERAATSVTVVAPAIDADAGIMELPSSAYIELPKPAPSAAAPQPFARSHGTQPLEAVGASDESRRTLMMSELAAIGVLAPAAPPAPQASVTSSSTDQATVNRHAPLTNRVRGAAGEPVELDVGLAGVLQSTGPAPADEREIAERLRKLAEQPLIFALDDVDPKIARAAFSELMDRGLVAVPAVGAAFPGKLKLDRRNGDSALQPLEKHGSLVWLVGLQPTLYASTLFDLMRAESADARYYATLIVARHPEPEAVPHLVDRVFDRDDQTKAIALRFIDSIRGTPQLGNELHRLRTALVSGDQHRREAAISAVQAARDEGSVSILIGLLDERALAERASQALARIAFMDFGPDVGRWQKWYRSHGTDGRVRWLLDAMLNKDRRVRENAAREIRTTPRLVVNYHADLDRRALEVAQRTVQRFFAK